MGRSPALGTAGFGTAEATGLGGGGGGGGGGEPSRESKLVSERMDNFEHYYLQSKHDNFKTS